MFKIAQLIAAKVTTALDQVNTQLNEYTDGNLDAGTELNGNKNRMGNEGLVVEFNSPTPILPSTATPTYPKEASQKVINEVHTNHFGNEVEKTLIYRYDKKGKMIGTTVIEKEQITDARTNRPAVRETRTDYDENGMTIRCIETKTDKESSQILELEESVNYVSTKRAGIIPSKTYTTLYNEDGTITKKESDNDSLV